MTDTTQPVTYPGKHSPAWRERLALLAVESLADSSNRVDSISRLLHHIVDETGIQFAGIRLQKGRDYPFHVFSGYTPEFILKENIIAATTQEGGISADHNSPQELECLCRQVILGSTDPGQRFFTSGGSFFTAGLQSLIAAAESNQSDPLRNSTTASGYETLALVPLRHSNEIIGLLHLSDARPDMLTPDDIVFFEKLGVSIGIALSHIRFEKMHAEQKQELSMRIKELLCLYNLAKLTENPEIPLDSILQKAAEILPSAWLHSDTACARVSLEDRVFQSPDFIETPWQQRADIVIKGRQAGAVQVCYRVSHETADEGPFLSEERTLIITVAELLSRIIEHLLAADALREIEKRQLSILENLQDGYLRIDSNGNIIMVSPSVLRIYGYDTIDELIGTPASALYLNTADRQAVLDEIRMRGRANDIVGKGRKKDGSIFWVSLNAQFFYDEQGQILGTEGFIRDVTERLEREEALRRSEEQYRQIVTTANEGIFIINQDHHFTFVNDRMSGLLGYTKEEMLGINAASLASPQDMDRHIQQMKNRQDMVGTSERQFIRKDGAIISALVSSTPIYDDRGNREGWLGMVTDITEFKRIEGALHIEREKFAKYLDIAPSIIVTLDVQGHITHLNKFGAQSLEIEAAEALGKNWFDTFIPVEVFKYLNPKFRKLIAGDLQTFETVENQIITGKGNIKTVLWHNTILKDEEGAIVGSISSGIDISDWKRAEEERNRLQAQLFQAQKMESIGTLAGGIAHDFNNLLGSVMINLSLIEMELKGHPEFRENIAEMKTAVEQGADLAWQLLSFARRRSIDTVPLDLNVILKESSRMFGRTRKDIIIHIDCSDESLIVMADRTQIEQVLLNLFLNAGQAMPQGGHLSIATEKTELSAADTAPHGTAPGMYVKLSVTDNGVGMDAETCQRVFEPFFTTKETGKGTGLGLASVFGIVKNHGGFVTVQSEPGKGTTFTVYIPSSEREVTKDSVVTVSPRQGSETILVVDDEEHMLKACSHLLNALGYGVMTAYSGREALEIFRLNHHQISLVILDIIMPEMGGLQVFEALRDIDPSVKVLLASGYNIESLAAEILENRFTGFIEKPFGITAISDKLRMLLC
ncbi:MAG: PAS domain S-box protein [Vulcanimicrobiota bacterium]